MFSMKALFDQSAAEKVKIDGPFLTVNQSLFTEVEVAEHTIIFVLFYTKEHVLFVCEQTCDQMIPE